MRSLNQFTSIKLITWNVTKILTEAYFFKGDTKLAIKIKKFCRQICKKSRNSVNILTIEFQMILIKYDASVILSLY